MAGTHAYDATVEGTDSVTALGVSGRDTCVMWVAAYFHSAGPQTGTLQLKSGSAVIWEAAVSGGLQVPFGTTGWNLGGSVDATLVCSGAHILLAAVTLEAT